MERALLLVFLLAWLGIPAHADSDNGANGTQARPEQPKAAESAKRPAKDHPKDLSRDESFTDVPDQGQEPSDSSLGTDLQGDAVGLPPDRREEPEDPLAELNRLRLLVDRQAAEIRALKRKLSRYESNKNLPPRRTGSSSLPVWHER